MPELPEVETMRRGVEVIRGGQILGVRRPRTKYRPIHFNPSPVTIRRRVTGRRIEKVDRVGKRLVLRLSGDQALVFEPRMTGLLLLCQPPTTAHLRFGLKLANAPVEFLWFWDRRGLGTISLMDSAQQQEALGPTRLGPDALDVTAEQLRHRLRTSRREIKVALLDQQAIAGIGNLYASEILHVAAVHPQARCHCLRKLTWEAIHRALRHVLLDAIRYEGSTLSDGTYRNALFQKGSYQNHHRVYGQSGALCPTCGEGPIRRIVQAQRATSYCPSCQTKRR